MKSRRRQQSENIIDNRAPDFAAGFTTLDAQLFGEAMGLSEPVSTRDRQPPGPVRIIPLQGGPGVDRNLIDVAASFFRGGATEQEIWGKSGPDPIDVYMAQPQGPQGRRPDRTLPGYDITAMINSMLESNKGPTLEQTQRLIGINPDVPPQSASEAIDRAMRIPGSSIKAMAQSPVSDAERATLAYTLLAEAEGGGAAGMTAVANVIRNRSESGAYPGNPYDVAMQPGHFDGATPAHLAAATKRNPAGSKGYETALAIVDSVILGATRAPDPTGGALMFHAASSAAPYWSGSAKTDFGTINIGGNLFYMREAPGAAVTTASKSAVASVTGSMSTGITGFDFGTMPSLAPDIVWNGYNAGLDADVVQVLNDAQQFLDFPITLRSGYRTKEENEAVGGAPHSQHLHGNAVDISLEGLNDAERTQLTRALAQSGATRIGTYSGNTGMHFDMMPVAPYGDYSVWPMFDRTVENIDDAQPWFLAGIDGTILKPLDIPAVALDPAVAMASTILTPGEVKKAGPTPAAVTEAIEQRIAQLDRSREELRQIEMAQRMGTYDRMLAMNLDASPVLDMDEAGNMKLTDRRPQDRARWSSELNAFITDEARVEVLADIEAGRYPGVGQNSFDMIDLAMAAASPDQPRDPVRIAAIFDNFVAPTAGETMAEQRQGRVVRMAGEPAPAQPPIPATMSKQTAERRRGTAPAAPAAPKQTVKTASGKTVEVGAIIQSGGELKQVTVGPDGKAKMVPVVSKEIKMAINEKDTIAGGYIKRVKQQVATEAGAAASTALSSFADRAASAASIVSSGAGKLLGDLFGGSGKPITPANTNKPAVVSVAETRAEQRMARAPISQPAVVKQAASPTGSTASPFTSQDRLDAAAKETSKLATAISKNTGIPDSIPMVLTPGTPGVVDVNDITRVPEVQMPAKKAYARPVTQPAGPSVRRPTVQMRTARTYDQKTGRFIDTKVPLSQPRSQAEKFATINGQMTPLTTISGKQRSKESIAFTSGSSYLGAS